MDFGDNNNEIEQNENYYSNNPIMYFGDDNNSKFFNEIFKFDPQSVKKETPFVSEKPKRQIFNVINSSNSNNNLKSNSSFTASETGKKRGKYKMYNSDLKDECLNLLNTMTVKQVAKLNNIPIKSLKRWITVGAYRKKGIYLYNLGGGRKVRDPEMERSLFEWYNERIERGYIITSKEFKNKASDLSKCKEFKASKGWLEKLKKKYGLVLAKSKNKSTEVQIKIEKN